MVLYMGDIFAAINPTFRLKIPKGDNMISALSLTLSIVVLNLCKLTYSLLKAEEDALLKKTRK